MRSLFAAGALAVLLPLVALESASAAIDPTSYHRVDATHPYSSSNGGHLSCPTGMRAVASGATSSGLHDVLTAGLTTFDGMGVFVTGAGGGDSHLQASARCVNAAQLQASTLATSRIRDHRSEPYPAYTHVGRASCPPGTVVYGGGGFFQKPGGEPSATGAVYASLPGANGSDWFFAATGTLFPDTEMWVGAHCLPRSQFGELTTLGDTDNAPPGPGYHTLYATARCPAGYSAYAGGARLHHGSDSLADWVGYLTVSDMTADDRGWFARAWTFAEGAQLSATVQCMTRVIDRPRP